MAKKISQVGLYIRKSRDDESNEALERQQQVLIDMCVKNIWKYDIYKEVGSSQDLDRPELQKMLDKVKGFHYDAIVCADLDRLSRNTGHFGTIKEILINYGCVVVTPTKVYDFTVQEDDLFSDIQSVLAKNEYQTIKKRLVRGSRQSAKGGSWMGKKNPVGYIYNKETKKLEISEDAQIIKMMFQEYLNGLSTKDIANKFITQGITTTTGMIWTPAGISRLLNNPVYKGDSLYGKTKTVNGKRHIKTSEEEQILVKGTHEAIVDKEMWEMVQKVKLNRNSRPIPLKLGKHKFSGLIKCRLCGRVHSFQASRGGKKRITSCQTRYYKDESLDNYKMCENKGVNLDTFEKLFFSYLSLYIKELEKYKKIIQESKSSKKDSPTDRINIIEKQMKKIQHEIKRVQQGYVMEIFTNEEAQSQIKTLKLQNESLEKELEKLNIEVVENETDYIDITIEKLTNFLKGHDKMPEVKANNILREFIDSIIYKRIGNIDAEIELKIIWKQSLEGEVK